MNVKVDKTLVASVALHVVVIGWGLLSFSARSLEAPPESLDVDVISADQLSKVTAGIKTGEKDKAKPLVEKVAEAKPVDDAIGKITQKKEEIVTSSAPQPQPKAEEKPVEKKPDPPKPVVENKAKDEPKQAEKQPEPKIDPIAEALKAEQSKKPKPKPEAKAAPPTPPKPKQERVFDQTKIAALLDKRDPTHQAITGAALNSSAALGLAHGKAADNSATWGALFREQVNRCWKKPYGGIEAQRVEAEFDIKLKKDGTLEGMPTVITRPSSDYQRVFLESGLRAILDCAPYKLPQGFFEEWKWFTPVFDSRDVI